MDQALSPELIRLRELTSELVGPELFGRLIEALPDALVVVNAAGHIIIFNAQAELLFGYHRSEVLGQAIEMLIPHGVREAHVGHRTRFAACPQGRPMGIGLELAAATKSGDNVPVDINLSPIMTTSGLCVAAVVRRK
jgi:PAS domain S-box-containing protein